MDQFNKISATDKNLIWENLKVRDVIYLETLGLMSSMISSRSSSLASA